jgi:hypothetical protein
LDIFEDQLAIGKLTLMSHVSALPVTLAGQHGARWV